MNSIWGLPIQFKHKRFSSWGLPLLFDLPDDKKDSEELDYSKDEMSWTIEGNSLSNQIPFEIVIRSSHERTTEMCVHYVNLYAPPGSNVTILYKNPFSKALQKCFEIGHSSSHDFLFTIDSDVILLSQTFSIFKEFIDSTFGEFDECHSNGYCGLYLKSRSIGPRIYNKRCLSKIIPEISVNDIRPESNAIERCGLKKNVIQKTSCLHDFGQWRRDIYRKGMLYYKKHNILQMKNVIEKLREIDNKNYKVFLQGIKNHKSMTHQDLMNSKNYPELPSWVEERSPILKGDYDFLVNQWTNQKLDLYE
jgi:hypothetical protein